MYLTFQDPASLLPAISIVFLMLKLIFNRVLESYKVDFLDLLPAILFISEKQGQKIVILKLIFFSIISGVQCSFQVCSMLERV